MFFFRVHILFQLPGEGKEDLFANGIQPKPPVLVTEVQMTTSANHTEKVLGTMGAFEIIQAKLTPRILVSSLTR